MPKFKVREGYAYFHPQKKHGFKAGEVVEIPDIAFGDQAWKLESIGEAEKPAEKPKAPEAPSEGPKDTQPTATPEEGADVPVETQTGASGDGEKPEKGGKKKKFDLTED